MNDAYDRPRTRSSIWPAVGLVLILIVAAALRFDGLDWDESAHLHPDERFLTQVEAGLEPTFSIREYFSTATSPLNPHNRGFGFFVYGTLPIILTRYVAEGLNSGCATTIDCSLHYVGYDGVHLVGRALSATFDLLAVVVIYAIGRRLYDRRVGLLAAALGGATVLLIQHAHFFTVDSFLTFFAALAFYFAVRVADGGNWWDWALFGVSLGFALACKISVWPMALVLVLAAAIRLYRQRVPPLTQALAGLALAGAVTFAAFRVTQPYAFVGPGYTPETLGRDRYDAATLMAPGWWKTADSLLPGFVRVALLPSPEWLANMRSIQDQMTGNVDIPFNHQWTDRRPIVFPWKNLVLYGMGPFLGLAAWLGWAAAIVQMLRTLPAGAQRRDRPWLQHAMPILWVTLFFLYQGTQWVKSMRYLLPIYPILIVLAAWLLVAGWDWARVRSRPMRWLAAGLVGLVLVPTYLWALAFTNIYRQPLTRLAASRWIFANVPTGATLLVETAQGEAEVQVPVRRFDYEQDGGQQLTRFDMPVDGVATGVRMNYLSDPLRDPEPELFRVTLAIDAGGMTVLTWGERALDVEQAQHVRGDAFPIDLPPASLAAGQSYYLITEVVAGAPVHSTGAYVVNESSWDDGLPWRVDGLDGFSIYEGEPFELYWEDDESKRERMIQLLDQGEYLFISSTRQLGSITRLPPRYPMTLAYYQALFEGRLGYELVQTFMADIRIGPLVINDAFGQLGWGDQPAVGWPAPGEWAAEEAFSVYDHPPVWIFKKRPDYSPVQVRATLSAVDLNTRRFVIPLDYTEELKAERRERLLDGLLPGGQAEAEPEEPRSMFLPPDVWQEQREGGTWRAMFDPDGVLSTSPAIGAAVWWLTVTVLGWLAFPLSFWAMNGLTSKGYVVSKALALLLVAWLSWILASLRLLPYTRGTILLAIAMLAATSAALLLGRRRRRELVQYVRANWRLLLTVEALGIGLFVISLLIRSGNPDLWHPSYGGEKPLNLAFLNAVIKSTSFPPYDPWLAGAFMDYYYFGYVIVGSLIKLLGVVPNVGYNLALSMLFALTGIGAFSISFDLVAGLERKNGLSAWTKKALYAGLAAAVVVVLLGNLGQVWTIVGGWYKLGGPEDNPLLRVALGLWRNLKGDRIPIYPGSWYWDATRIIPPAEGEAGPIAEFPFFTFLYADLHAHMINMPMVLLALAWALGLAQSADRARREGWGWRWAVTRALPGLILTWVIGGLVIGSLRATNTWDWPTFLGVGAVAILYWAWRRHQTQGWLAWAAAAGVGLVGLVGLGGLFFQPFTDNFVPAYTEVMRWTGGITPIWAYFAVHGLFLFVLVTLLGREFADWAKHLSDDRLEALEPWGWLIGLGVLLFLALMAVSLALGAPVGPLVVLMMALAGLLALQSRLPAERRAVLMLFTLGLALTLAVEYVVMSGDISRMNTVFKFYTQVWLILSAIGGAALVWSWQSVRRWKPGRRQAWLALLGVLIFAAALYPPTAARAKINDRFHADQPSAGLDGMVYMVTATHHDQDQAMPLIYDYQVIRWLQDNVDGSPVIMEANTYPKIYGWGNRISIYTGLPSVVGWEWHTRQHRAGFPTATDEVRRRASDVIAFYNTSDLEQAVNTLRRYQVEYVVVGPLERAYYSPEGLDKLDLMAELGLIRLVYRNEGASIYEVVQDKVDRLM